MNKYSDKSLANNTLSNITGLILIIGSVLHYIGRGILFGAPFKNDVIAATLFMFTLGVIAFFVKYLKISETLKTYVLTITVLMVYLIITYYNERLLSLTLWGSIFIFMMITLLYSNRILLTAQVVAFVCIELYYIIYREPKTVRIDETDHFARICMVLLVAAIAFYVGSLLKKRSNENQQIIRTISSQNQQIQTLLDESKKKAAILERQNNQLHEAYNRIYELEYFNNTTGLKSELAFQKEYTEHTNDALGHTTHEHFACILIQIEDLKSIRETYSGYDFEDLMMTMSETLMTIVPADYRIFHINSDDFVILTPHSSLKKPYKSILEKIYTNIASNNPIGLEEINIEINTAIVQYNPDYDTADKMLLQVYSQLSK